VTLDDIATGEADGFLTCVYLGDWSRNLGQERENQIDPSIAWTVELENLDAKVRIGKLVPTSKLTMATVLPLRFQRPDPI